jgi:SAM-dependent methyltransferase
MSDQSHAWSDIAGRYESEFVDPYRRARRNPLPAALAAIPDGQAKTAADLGCGIGPLLPPLARQFARVLAIDFAPGMLEQARQRCAGLLNVEFHQRSLTDLSSWHGQVDVACAVNSLVMPRVEEIERVLEQVRALLRPGGVFLGIVPGMDAVHYQTMLLVDRARQTGMPEATARQNAARHGEHELYDFAFGDFRYAGLEQHFWQPFEVPYRLKRAGFANIQRRRVRLSWGQFACGSDLRKYPPPWDWFFRAEVASDA